MSSKKSWKNTNSLIWTRKTKKYRKEYLKESSQQWICTCKAEEDNPLTFCAYGCLNRAMYMECDISTCPVGELCRNRMVQKGLELNFSNTEIRGTESAGRGLFAKEDIPAGLCLGQYTGKVIFSADVEDELTTLVTVQNEVRDEWERKHPGDDSMGWLDDKRLRVPLYFFQYDKIPGVPALTVDAKDAGTFARFINHSCDPNSKIEMWKIPNSEPVLAVFTARPIKAGEEITWDYAWDSNEFSWMQRCFCGSHNCKGIIGAAKSSIRRVPRKPKSRKRKKPLQPFATDEQGWHEIAPFDFCIKRRKLWYAGISKQNEYLSLGFFSEKGRARSAMKEANKRFSKFGSIYRGVKKDGSKWYYAVDEITKSTEWFGPCKKEKDAAQEVDHNTDKKKNFSVEYCEKTDFKGVVRIPGACWLASIEVEEETVYMGAFATQREAIICRDNRLKSLGLANDQLNFPETFDIASLPEKLPMEAEVDGVEKTGKGFRAFTMIGSKYEILGTFQTIDEAALCRDRRIFAITEDLSRLHFPSQFENLKDRLAKVKPDACESVVTVSTRKKKLKLEERIPFAFKLVAEPEEFSLPKMKDYLPKIRFPLYSSATPCVDFYLPEEWIGVTFDEESSDISPVSPVLEPPPITYRFPKSVRPLSGSLNKIDHRYESMISFHCSEPFGVQREKIDGPFRGPEDFDRDQVEKLLSKFDPNACTLASPAKKTSAASIASPTGDQVKCMKCGQCDDDDAFLLCEYKCKTTPAHGGHYYCFGLLEIPKEKWYCSEHLDKRRAKHEAPLNAVVEPPMFLQVTKKPQMPIVKPSPSKIIPISAQIGSHVPRSPLASRSKRDSGTDDLVPPMQLPVNQSSTPPQARVISPNPERSPPPPPPARRPRKLSWPRRTSRGSQMETEDINKPFYQPPNITSAPRTRKKRQSRYRGVSWNFLERRWVAKLGASVLGLFDHEEDAAKKVRDEMKSRNGHKTQRTRTRSSLKRKRLEPLSKPIKPFRNGSFVSLPPPSTSVAPQPPPKRAKIETNNAKTDTKITLESIFT